MTPKQEKALRMYLQEAIVPLIEQVLVKKLGQAMTFAAEQLVQPKRQCDMGVMCIECPDAQPKREWAGLTDEQKEALSQDAEGNPWAAVELAEAKLKELNT